MAYRVPPLLTPFAILSAVLALGATNVAVNKVTHTSEGRQITQVSSSVSESIPRADSSDQKRIVVRKTKIKNKIVLAQIRVLLRQVRRQRRIRRILIRKIPDKIVTRRQIARLQRKMTRLLISLVLVLLRIVMLLIRKIKIQQRKAVGPLPRMVDNNYRKEDHRCLVF